MTRFRRPPLATFLAVAFALTGPGTAFAADEAAHPATSATTNEVSGEDAPGWALRIPARRVQTQTIEESVEEPETDADSQGATEDQPHDDNQPQAEVPLEPEAEQHGPDALHSFADPSTIWGEGIEAEIERAYRASFRTYVIDEQIVTLRMPFAQNNERAELAGTDLIIQGDGKADPAFLWNRIDSLLKTRDFDRYLDALSDGREKVVVFDLPSQTWSTSRDLFDVAGMRAGSYRGLPYRPYVHVDGEEVRPRDIYNYLYSVGRVGMDCSGFVWHVLSSVGETFGIDLGAELAPTLGVRNGQDASFYVGTQFFDSASRELIQVDDEIRNLKPGDVMLFRSRDGRAGHSAVVQSIDYENGVIRYIQSTDEAPQDERGVHESFIYFDAMKPETSLGDPSLQWTQDRFAPFPGEYASAFSNDGERYRADFGNGGGKVVRLKALANLHLAEGHD